MKTVVFRSRITARRTVGGMAAILALLLFTQPCFAGGDDHRALQLLLKKGVITQQEYDQAVQEDEREEQRERQAIAITKHGLEFKLGGFAEIDFIEDNTRSFQETIGNRPVLRSDTLAGANSQFLASPRNSRIRIDVLAPERDGIKTRFHASFDFLGNQPAVGTSGVSEFSSVTSPVARIFKMFFLHQLFYVFTFLPKIFSSLITTNVDVFKRKYLSNFCKNFV